MIKAYRAYHISQIAAYLRQHIRAVRRMGFHYFKFPRVELTRFVQDTFGYLDFSGVV
jgi:hypothetical protein